MLIWRDSIFEVGGQSWIDDSWYHSPERIFGGLWHLVCGAYEIGIATSQETLLTYATWHKALIKEYAKHESAGKIATKTKELGRTTFEVSQHYWDSVTQKVYLVVVSLKRINK